LSGLIVDVFGDVAVVASSAAWVEKYRPQIELYISKISNINLIKWRLNVDILKEEGLEISDYKNIKECPDLGTYKINENGISFLVSLDGQKTGFYADQRDNRCLIHAISKNLRVLDVFCYSGGFALNAAAGGADHVIGIDSSLPALELAKRKCSIEQS
ncbi:hypothetical protein HPP92_028077, partial [Vanilla planifolia]